MSEEPTTYKELVEKAYDAVKELGAPEEYKLAGYRIVLKALLPGTAPAVTSPQQPQAGSPTSDVNQIVTGDWQMSIASKIGITPEQVAEIYHFTDEGVVELIIEGKDLPKTNSKSTQHIAALLMAGRQALGNERATSIDTIRSACEYYRVYDGKNFMKYLRQLGPKFRFEGGSVELTNGAFKIAGEIAVANYLEKK